MTASRLRLIGWLGMAAIAALSLIPGDVQVRTGAPKTFEHFMAYLCVGGVMALAATGWRRGIRVAILLTLAAVVFEIVQAWVPGRSAGFADFVASAAGAWAGVAVAQVIGVMWRRRAVGSMRPAAGAGDQVQAASENAAASARSRSP